MAKLVFDTSPLSHFARAGRLDLLERLTAADERFVTRAVLDELRRGVAQHPALGDVLQLAWLQEVATDSLDEIRAFGTYAARLVAGSRNVGEASTLAWAEVHGAEASVDDFAARKLAQERSIPLRGTVRLVCGGVRAGVLTVDEGRRLLSDLRRAGAWLPWSHDEYDEWARRSGLL